MKQKKTEAQKALNKEMRKLEINPDKLVYAESDIKLVDCWADKKKRVYKIKAVRPIETIELSFFSQE